MVDPKQAHLDILPYILIFVKYNLRNLFLSGHIIYTDVPTRLLYCRTIF